MTLQDAIVCGNPKLDPRAYLVTPSRGGEIIGRGLYEIRMYVPAKEPCEFTRGRVITLLFEKVGTFIRVSNE